MPPPLSRLAALKPALAAAAQEVYEEWDQDGSGFDAELGEGGICHIVAERIAAVLDANGFPCAITDSNGVGENHVWATAQTSDGVVSVDIPPQAYESGGGYRWRKKPGILLGPDDVAIDVVFADPARFADFVDGPTDEPPAPAI